MSQKVLKSVRNKICVFNGCTKLTTTIVTIQLGFSAKDAFSYKELADKNSCVTWKEGQRALCRIYNKRMYRVKGKRREIQESPNKPFKDAINDKLVQDLDSG